MKINFKTLFAATLAVAILFIAGFIILYKGTLKRNQWYIEEKNRADSLQRVYTYKFDSLSSELGNYIEYSGLYLAIEASNKALSKQKYRPGQIVFIKPDSTRVVISKFITGITNNEYYTKYEIIKNNDKIEIDPVLIY